MLERTLKVHLFGTVTFVVTSSSTIISMAQDILVFKIEMGSLIRSVGIIPEEVSSLDSKIDFLSNEVKSLQTTNADLVNQLHQEQQRNNELLVAHLELQLQNLRVPY